jgi:hypothetical protein
MPGCSMCLDTIGIVQDHKNYQFRIVSKRVGDPHRIRGVKGSSQMLRNYKELNVWQKSYELCLEVYEITTGLSTEER